MRSFEPVSTFGMFDSGVHLMNRQRFEFRDCRSKSFRDI